jgi:hypothetical protein
LAVDTRFRKAYKKVFLDSCLVYCGSADGSIIMVDLTDWATNLPFQLNKQNRLENPHRHVRENFEMQLKKLINVTECKNDDCQEFQGPAVELGGHSSGMTSLEVAEFEEHLLISTGKDQRIKIWREGQLVADLNVNVSHLL